MQNKDLLAWLRRGFPLRSEHILPKLEKFKQDLALFYPEKNFDLILFGSYARGDFRADSDIDLLLLLPDFRSVFYESDRLSELKYNYLLEHELLLSVLIAKKLDFLQNDKLIYKKIKKEGILI